MKAFIKYLWCKIRGHKVRRERSWDMIGNALTDWWYTYHCNRCGDWR